ncbi:MHO_1590 family protein [Mycoplasma marinum]|uniref:Uncharacterized protein n=1 Tax=Mycoplasma marinum TaxID=1937190 RepID=A0A4R0XKP2_9MOLU|nr:hypothetical protein [Mycoplasma marinum]TCG11226.1 hypothetical protein C4B24_02595 [Mycoplasma marinum]
MRRYLSYIFVGSPIVASVIGISIYYSLNHKSNKKSQKQDTEVTKGDNISVSKKIYKSESIFPQVSFDEVYDYIRVKNQKPIIDDNMISKFIKIIFMRIKTTKGEIKVDVLKNSDQSVDVKFTWKQKNMQTLEKIYKMELSY